MFKSINARIVTKDRIERRQVIFDEDSGLIEGLQPAGENSKTNDYYYGDECLLFPAMGDVHVHAREDSSGLNTYKEDFLSASKAAIQGGVLFYFDMPNNPCPPIDESSYKTKFLLTSKSPIPIGLYGGIGPGTSPLNAPIPYKAYMGPSIGELYFKTDEDLDQSLGKYLGQYVSFHCEDPEILERSQTCKDHEGRRPPAAEVMATSKALALIEKYQLNGKLCHYSTREGLELIKKAKANGIPVQCEVTPQHLYYSQEELAELSPSLRILFQMNPPLRTREDRDALLEAVKRGEIDFLATDHAPHSLEEKLKGTSGLTGLDTFGPFVTWLIVEKKVNPCILHQMCCENPGNFFNHFLRTFLSYIPSMAMLGKGMGRLEKGHSASFTILNLNRPLTVTKDFLRTKAKNSPFEGVTFPGSVEATFFQGKIVR